MKAKKSKANFPSGPHYRVTSNSGALPRVAAEDLMAARATALNMRALGRDAQIEVTDDLGLTWASCTDDGERI